MHNVNIEKHDSCYKIATSISTAHQWLYGTFMYKIKYEIVDWDVYLHTLHEPVQLRIDLRVFWKIHVNMINIAIHLIFMKDLWDYNLMGFFDQKSAHCVILIWWKFSF